eukprot:m.290012 g.290012  ORF g.290012 m.290012 type:complete len:99 (-) comp27117_c1_seq5:635-931(-)
MSRRNNKYNEGNRVVFSHKGFDRTGTIQKKIEPKMFFESWKYDVVYRRAGSDLQSKLRIDERSILYDSAASVSPPTECHLCHCPFLFFLEQRLVVSAC